MENKLKTLYVEDTKKPLVCGHPKLRNRRICLYSNRTLRDLKFLPKRGDKDGGSKAPGFKHKIIKW